MCAGGTAYPTIAWGVYDHYGDLDVLRLHFQGVKGWVEYLRAEYTKGGLKGISFIFGDWDPPPPYPQTDGHLIASFAFLKDTQTILRIATLLNDSATVKDYTALRAQQTKDFNTLFYKSGTVGYADGSQAANALALALGVVEDVPAVVAALVANITALGHFTVGVTSVSVLFPMLSTHGHHDLALQLAQQTAYPSYGWSLPTTHTTPHPLSPYRLLTPRLFVLHRRMFTNEIENATTLWERWDSPLEYPLGNSRNHIMYGSIGAWFYRYVAGLALNGLGVMSVRPRMPYDWRLMRRLQAEVVTIKGPLAVAYERGGEEGEEVEMEVTVPLNARAVVTMEPLVEGGKCKEIWEGGVLLYEGKRGVGSGKVADVEGVGAVTVDGETGAVSVDVEGGKFSFTAKWE